jgi:hypothetical protein
MKSESALFTLAVILGLLFLISSVSAEDNVSDSNELLLGDIGVNDIEVSQNCSDYIVFDKDFVLSIDLTNVGESTLNNLSVLYKLPEGIELIISSGDYDNGVWSINSIEPKKTATLSFVAKPHVSNTELTSNVFFDDEIVSTMDFYVHPVADLLISESHEFYDNLLFWTIEVLNNGPDVAYNSSVYGLPTDAINGYVADLGYVENGIWNIGDLNIGQAVKLVMVVDLNKYAEGIYYIHVMSDDYDSDLSNNLITISIPSVNGTTNDTNQSVIPTIPVHNIAGEAAGNPLAILLLALFAIPFTIFKRF